MSAGKAYRYAHYVTVPHTRAEPSEGPALEGVFVLFVGVMLILGLVVLASDPSLLWSFGQALRSASSDATQLLRR